MNDVFLSIFVYICTERYDKAKNTGKRRRSEWNFISFGDIIHPCA